MRAHIPDASSVDFQKANCALSLGNGPDRITRHGQSLCQNLHHRLRQNLAICCLLKRRKKYPTRGSRGQWASFGTVLSHCIAPAWLSHHMSQASTAKGRSRRRGSQSRCCATCCNPGHARRHWAVVGQTRLHHGCRCTCKLAELLDATL